MVARVICCFGHSAHHNVVFRLNLYSIGSIGYLQIMTSFSIFRQHLKKSRKKLSKVLNTFENIMENGALFSMIFSNT